MWDQTVRDWASTSLSESDPPDNHTRPCGAYLHLGRTRERSLVRVQYGPLQDKGLSGWFRAYDCGTAPVKARFYKQATKVKSCLLAP